MNELLTCSNEEWYTRIKSIIHLLDDEAISHLFEVARARYKLEPFYRDMNFAIDNDEVHRLPDGRYVKIPSATSGNETVRLHSESTLSAEEWYKELDLERYE